MDPVEIRRRNLIRRRRLSLRFAVRPEVRTAVASRRDRQADGDDGLRRAARRAGALAQEEHPSRHRHRELHRDHQSECGVLWRRRRAHLVAGRRRGADRRHRRGDLPDQHHRAGPGLGIAHRADRRQRARRRRWNGSASFSATPTTRPMAAAPGPRAAPASAARPRCRPRKVLRGNILDVAAAILQADAGRTRYRRRCGRRTPAMARRASS